MRKALKFTFTIGVFFLLLCANKIVLADKIAMPTVTYQSQVENIGWQSTAAQEQISGTVGQGLRDEAFKINLVDAPDGAQIKYQAHVENLGWQNEVTGGNIAGTVGQALRVEAMKVSLVNMPGYSVEYRAQVENLGWQPWVSDGQIAGTIGSSLRLEAFQVRIVKAARVESISLNKTLDTLFVGNTDKNLKAMITPENAAVKTIKWTSSNPEVASVDDNGQVTGVSAGEVTITATTVDGNKIASCNYTVSSINNVSSVNINKSTDNLKVGDFDTLSANILPDNATEKAVRWTSSNSSIVSVDNITGKIKAVSAGNAVITATTVDGGKTAACSVTVLNPKNDGISVSYSANINGSGWQNKVSDGEVSGTVGQGISSHGFKIELLNAPQGAGITYSTKVINGGWTYLVRDGAESNADEPNADIEAITVSLLNMPGYHVQYQAQIQNIGWQDWVSDGAIAGTPYKGLRLEALRIRIVKDFSVQYKAKFEDNALTENPVSDGAIIDTSGQAAKMEGIQVNLENAPEGAKVEYEVHVENIGWMSSVYDGAVAGADGQNLRIEALKMRLINAPNFSIKYQVDVQGIGWTNWASNGEIAGSTGLGLRIQGIRIKVYFDNGTDGSNAINSSPNVTASIFNSTNYKLSEYLRPSCNIQSTNEKAIQLHGGITSNNCVYFSSTALRMVGINVPTDMCNTGVYTNFLASLGWSRQIDYDLLTPGSICFTVDDDYTCPTHTYVFLDWVNPDDHTLAYVADNQSGSVHIRSLVATQQFDPFAYFMHE
ncbi:uncharacterized protein YjdB [Clostridium acetobutylicum]|uniref:Protein containing ChW-repeats and cell-adhesion domain n=1 Tax=Clostridium acetobutylicum (strain ATCC 824 / DSM 792 / JCM 1419 / IAM 19013 / LMG 5710 / NBRC 13948 / NRRL B-527 / VKM B-1787 / 2291 / W) TaxID=272562 RepID=Q97J97_CLOAB|nr:MULTISPECIES: Ig-like domain-containing protein [Clostridium]AAK79357.1 Protein containing ChW-repeats and cell-adhesion domain [Clostridium acetobutylicum ATCC 824]ADZ20441.1 Protein containing ChW-repeats and cell-adhesion domain [Clostridium acetobutylicum EA 2018]AEI31786.1 ChW repeat-containing and cell-adhesion domain-containing protein [Clostridium acetobutylicum DSM 1731]AWV81394.1 hypothetical protein DK921_15090 [Clostridium acetobutylicum]MBC2393028.1 hypothetical protein [Clostr